LDLRRLPRAPARRDPRHHHRRDTAVLGRERDFAAGMVKLRADQLENARDSRRSLWRLVEWQRDRDVAQVRANGHVQQELDARMGR
jgi:hypothetical protein